MLDDQKAKDAMAVCSSSISHFYPMQNLYDYNWSKNTELLGGYRYLMVKEGESIIIFLNETFKMDFSNFIIMKKHLNLVKTSNIATKRKINRVSRLALDSITLQDESILINGGLKFPDFKSIETQSFLMAYIGHFGIDYIINKCDILNDDSLQDDLTKHFAWSYLCKKNKKLLSNAVEYVKKEA